MERRVIFVREPANADEYAEFTPMYRAADWMIEDADPDAIMGWVATEPWEWAAESFDQIRQAEVHYCIKKGDACWYSETLRSYDGDEDNQRTVVMDEAYLDRFGPVVISRLTQAGYRLAATMEAALSD